MAICLETFPPPPQFENYLEIFLREKAPEASKERLIKTLHATVYGGQRPAPLTEAEMSQLLNGHSLRSSAFESKAAYQTPQAALPQRQAPQAIMGVIPVSAGGSGMSTYNPNANTSTSQQNNYQPQPVQPTYNNNAAPNLPGRPSMPMPPPPETDMPPPPPVVEREPCPWSVAYHPDTNQPYYYHQITNETTWTMPADYYE